MKDGTVNENSKSELEYYKTPRGLTGEALAVSPTSAATSAITDAILVDIVAATTGCFIEFGETPTAVVGTSYWLPADTIVRFPWRNGDKVAGVVAADTTTLQIHPVQ